MRSDFPDPIKPIEIFNPALDQINTTSFGPDTDPVNNPLSEYSDPMRENPIPEINKPLDPMRPEPDLREFRATFDLQRNFDDPMAGPPTQPFDPMRDPVTPSPPGVDMSEFNTTLDMQRDFGNPYPGPTDPRDDPAFRRVMNVRNDPIRSQVDFRPLDNALDMQRNMT
jgi:hypothetical protein